MTIIKRTDWNGNRYDWNRITPESDLLEDSVVQAAELTDVPEADVVAVWLDASMDPIYLIDRNRVLYYHLGIDENLEHLIFAFAFKISLYSCLPPSEIESGSAASASSYRFSLR